MLNFLSTSLSFSASTVSSQPEPTCQALHTTLTERKSIFQPCRWLSYSAGMLEWFWHGWGTGACAPNYIQTKLKAYNAHLHLGLLRYRNIKVTMTATSKMVACSALHRYFGSYSLNTNTFFSAVLKCPTSATAPALTNLSLMISADALLGVCKRQLTKCPLISESHNMLLGAAC